MNNIDLFSRIAELGFTVAVAGALLYWLLADFSRRLEVLTAEISSLSKHVSTLVALIASVEDKIATR